MENTEILEKPWVCDACGGRNYWWQHYCIHCLSENKSLQIEHRQESEDVQPTGENATEVSTPKEEFFLYDNVFKETISKSRYLLHSGEFRKFLDAHTDLIQKHKGGHGSALCKLIFLYSQLAIVQEQRFYHKKAAELFNNALTLWDKLYDVNDDYREFLLHRLSTCLGSSYFFLDHGPMHGPQITPRYELNGPQYLYKAKCSDNSLELLTICLSLTRLDFVRGRTSHATAYLIESLEIHEHMFWSAVKRILSDLKKNAAKNG